MYIVNISLFSDDDNHKSEEGESVAESDEVKIGTSDDDIMPNPTAEEIQNSREDEDFSQSSSEIPNSANLPDDNSQILPRECLDDLVSYIMDNSFVVGEFRRKYLRYNVLFNTLSM